MKKNIFVEAEIDGRWYCNLVAPEHVGLEIFGFYLAAKRGKTVERVNIIKPQQNVG